MVPGIIYSPDYCYRTLKPDGSEIAQSIAARRNVDEKPVFGFTTGISLLVMTNKRLFFETGIQYSTKGEQTRAIDIVWPQPGPSLPIKISSIHHYNYLDIPIKVNYHFAKSRRGFSLKFLKRVMRGRIPASSVGFFVSGGCSANVFLNESVMSTAEYSDGHTEINKSFYYGLSRMNIAAVAGIGMYYFVSEKMHIRIEPVFRHAITPIVDAPIKQYSYSAGINAGIYFSLR